MEKSLFEVIDDTTNNIISEIKDKCIIDINYGLEMPASASAASASAASASAASAASASAASESASESIFESITDILNEFITYYKKVNNRFDNTNMFNNIDIKEETSTNEIMEEFYSHIHEYITWKETRKDYIEIYSPKDIDDSDYEELYGILIDDELKIISPSMIAIIIKLIELKNIEIYNNYQIISVKG